MSKNTILPEGMSWNEFNGIVSISTDEDKWERIYDEDFGVSSFTGWKRLQSEGKRK